MKRCILVLVLVVGCKKAKKEEAPPPPPTPADAAAMTAPDAPPPTPADAATAAAPVVPDAPPGAIVVGDKGVGPLEKSSDISIKAMKAAFPGHEIKKVSTPMGDGDLKEEYVGVSKGGKLLLKVIGDSTPITIEAVSNDVWNPYGVTIGMTHADAVKLLGPLTCTDASEHTDWKSDIAECASEKSQFVGFDFAHESFEAKDLLKNPDKLATAKLVAVRWDSLGRIGDE